MSRYREIQKPTIKNMELEGVLCTEYDSVFLLLGLTPAARLQSKDIYAAIRERTQDILKCVH